MSSRKADLLRATIVRDQAKLKLWEADIEVAEIELAIHQETDRHHDCWIVDCSVLRRYNQLISNEPTY